MLDKDFLLGTGKEADYREAVGSTLKYMRFLGFPDNELSVEGVTAQYQEVQLLMHPEREKEQSGIIILNSRREGQLDIETTITLAISELEEAERNSAYRVLEEMYKHSLTMNEILQAKMDKMLGIERFDTAREDRTMLRVLESLTRQYEKFPTYEQNMRDCAEAEKFVQAIMEESAQVNLQKT